MMVTKSGSAAHRPSNGGSDFISGILWRNRLTAVKGCILFLFLSNMLYFAARYVELKNTVRRLEAEKAVSCSRLTTNEDSGNAKKDESKVDKTENENADGPQLNYSQVLILTTDSNQLGVAESEYVLRFTPSRQKKYYPYIFNEPNKCNDDDLKPLPVFLLIVIKSTTAQFDRRRSIRMTWGNEDNIEGIIIKRIFLVAKADDKKKQLLLEEESEEFHDIIQGDFHDSFRNLTIKDIMFMRWMTTYCPQVKFIFKGDDDVFVNINNIVDYLVSLSPEQAKNLFAGSVLYPSPRITDPKSKYYVSTNLWNEKYYPPYVSGGGFVMSSLVSKKVFEVTKVTPIIPIDDAYLGVCLKKLGIKPQNHKGFKSWGVNRRKDVCIYQEIMTLHKLNSDEMIEMWKKLNDKNVNLSDCATTFKIEKDDKPESKKAD